MFKKLSIIAAALLAVSGVLASKPSEAQSNGPGWYFFSVCAYYGTPASWLCGYGPYAYFGPYVSEAQCTSTVQLMINTHSVFATDPYALSTCFYMN